MRCASFIGVVRSLAEEAGEVPTSACGNVAAETAPGWSREQGALAGLLRRSVSAAVLDWGLPAGLAAGALNEVVAEYADRPAAFGFLSALTAIALGLSARAGPAVLVVSRRALIEHGTPYGHGLAQIGVDVGRLIVVATETDKDALWSLEETLRSQARPAMVAGVLAGGVDLTASRRLNLAAAPQRTPLVLLRGVKPAGQAASTNAAATRWRIASAPAARDRFGTLAAPRWHATLERSRLGSSSDIGMGGQIGRPGSWLIEWNHVTHRFRVVEGLADRPSAQEPAQGTEGTALRQAG